MESINFTVTKKKFCLSLHRNGANSYLLVIGTEIYKFKAKDSEIVRSPLCLGNISKGWSADNMEKTGFNGYVYDFSVDYDATDVDDIVDIHRLFDEKHRFVKKVFFIELTILSIFTNASSLSCISMNNQECKTKQDCKLLMLIVIIWYFFPFSIKTSKCSGNCNNIYNPYAEMCVLML